MDYNGTRTVVSDNRLYIWEGGFGAVITSKEPKSVKQGDVRVIERTLLYAYIVSKGFFKNRVCWSLVEKCTIESINEFKKKLLGV